MSTANTKKLKFINLTKAMAITLLSVGLVFVFWIVLWGMRTDEIYFSIAPSFDGAKMCAYQIGDIEFTNTLGFSYLKTGSKVVRMPRRANQMGTLVGIWQWDRKADVVIPILREADGSVMKIFRLTADDRNSMPWNINLSFYGDCK